MLNDETMAFNRALIQERITKDTLKEVYHSLKLKGYNPHNQIIGYLMTGDLNYISSYRDARLKMSKLDRGSILGAMLSEYLK